MEEVAFIGTAGYVDSQVIRLVLLVERPLQVRVVVGAHDHLVTRREAEVLQLVR